MEQGAFCGFSSIIVFHLRRHCQTRSVYKLASWSITTTDNHTVLFSIPSYDSSFPVANRTSAQWRKAIEDHTTADVALNDGTQKAGTKVSLGS